MLEANLTLEQVPESFLQHSENKGELFHILIKINSKVLQLSGQGPIVIHFEQFHWSLP